MPKLPSKLEQSIQEIPKKFSSYITQPWLFVDSVEQRLHVVKENSLNATYVISTSKFGLGCELDSFKTPIGAHKIVERIGGDQEINVIFKGRVATGEKGKIIHEKRSSKLDLILTRVLWLQGLEEQLNSGGTVDTYQRYIYIHGTHEEGLLGVPASHGCIRMSNIDVIDLYDLVKEGTFVFIA